MKKIFIKTSIQIVEVFLTGLFFMLIWNNVVPVIFGLIEINISQSIGILCLFNLLMDGFIKIKYYSSKTKKNKKYLIKEDKSIESPKPRTVL